MRHFYVFILIFLVFNCFSLNAEARRGCCSWHGGVAGCDVNTGHQLCRDGTDSPSCLCGY